MDGLQGLLHNRMIFTKETPPNMGITMPFVTVAVAKGVMEQRSNYSPCQIIQRYLVIYSVQGNSMAFKAKRKAKIL